MNYLNSIIRWFWPEPKNRASVIEGKVQDITKDLLISGFSNIEIAIITKTVCSDIKIALEDRKQLLTDELHQTTEVINKL